VPIVGGNIGDAKDRHKDHAQTTEGAK